MPPEYPCTVDEFENSLRSLKPALVFLTGWMMFAAPPKAVDLIVAGVCGVHSRAAVVAGLPLPIADQPKLQQRMHVLLQWKNLHHRIVEVECLAGMDIGSLLGGMKLVELIRRNRGRFVLGQVKGFACGRGIRPVAGAGVVARTCREPTGWREEGVSHLQVGSFQVPAQGKGLIEGVGKAATATDGA